MRWQHMEERDLGAMDGGFLERIVQGILRCLRKIGWDQDMGEGHGDSSHREDRHNRRLAYDRHRAWCSVSDLFRHAAHEDVVQPRTSVCSQNDEMHPPARRRCIARPIQGALYAALWGSPRTAPDVFAATMYPAVRRRFFMLSPRWTYLDGCAPQA